MSMAPWALSVYLMIVGTFLVVLGLVGWALKATTGATRRGRRKDALRAIEQVNKGGGLVDGGTIVIDAGRQRRVHGP